MHAKCKKGTVSAADKNMRTFVILLLGLAAVSAIPKNSQRIVGGSLTTIASYPEMAALLHSWDTVNYRQACGGTILNNRSVLTAAHCTVGDSANMWRLRTGSTFASSGGYVYRSLWIINHPNYNGRTYDCDAAIIRTSSTITFNSNVMPSRVAGPNYILGGQQVVYAPGWGTTSPGGPTSEQLRHVQIWTVDQNTCRQRYAAVGSTITDNMLCSGWLDVGGRDQCQGDSGGPLFHNRVVVGVCSWGRGCGQPQFPGVNARVSSFANWIAQNS